MSPLSGEPKLSVGIVGDGTVDRISVGVVENAPAKVKIVSTFRQSKICIERNICGRFQVVRISEDLSQAARVRVRKPSDADLRYIFEVGYGRRCDIKSDGAAGLRSRDDAIRISVLEPGKRQLEVAQQRVREHVSHVLRSGVAVSLKVNAVRQNPWQPVPVAVFVATLHSKKAVPLGSLARVVVRPNHVLVVGSKIRSNCEKIGGFTKSTYIVLGTPDIWQRNVSGLQHQTGRIVDLGGGNQCAVARSAGIRKDVLNKVRGGAACARWATGREGRRADRIIWIARVGAITGSKQSQPV